MSQRKVRRMQAVVPFGVGAIIDFPKEALMPAGLDVWPTPGQRGLVNDQLIDERLSTRLGVSYFRQPPVLEVNGRERPALPLVRFPLWHFCPRCRALKAADWNSLKLPNCESDSIPTFFGDDKEPCCNLSRGKQFRMVPLRFVAACKDGHIEDFPWSEWAHSNAGGDLIRGSHCDNPQIHLEPTGLGGLAGLNVICRNCNSRRTLSRASGEHGLTGLTCSGHRPWLGPDGDESCGEPLRMLQRGASNVYFPQVVSSILIPPFSTRSRQIIDDPGNWKKITSAITEDGLPDRSIVNALALFKEIDPDELWKAVETKATSAGASSATQTEEEYRFAEYRALKGGKREDENLVVTPQQINNYSEWFGEYFEHVSLIERLAETRVLVGFSRLEPEPLIDVHPGAQLSKNVKNWLPAYRVHGEGLFLSLRQNRVKEWIDDGSKRTEGLDERYRSWSEEMGAPARTIPPQFVLLHTLAHLLIRQLSFECGYGSSALRERIYCQQDGDDWMCGILIYTAAGDVEGTMGGLVSQAVPGRFEIVVKNALKQAGWCSSDPLCRESSGQGTNSLNLAACHACSLLPETSCEEQNRLLDRMTLVADHGYFKAIDE